MATTPEARHEHGAERIAVWSAIGGVLAALALTALTGKLLLNERISSATALGALGFSVAFLAPCAASLASLRIQSTELRRSVWLASGVLALGLAGVTFFSGFWLVFGMVGVGLVSAWWRSKSPTGVQGAQRPVVLFVWLLLWLGGALLVLWLRETPACWESTVNGSGWTMATLSTSNTCVSDIVDNTEGFLALVFAVIGLGGMVLLARRDRGWSSALS